MSYFFSEMTSWYWSDYQPIYCVWIYYGILIDI